MSKTSTTRPVNTPIGETVFANVLCAVNGTHSSFTAVEQAAVLAGPNGHLTLLAVTEIGASGAGDAGSYKSAAIAPARAQRILERAAGIAGLAGVSSTKVIDPASPARQVILERASGHDLLALGAPVTSRLGGMFIRGVAVKTIGAFSTPLLAARSCPEAHDGFARRILVASDGLEDCDDVVELAGRLADSQDASVVLVHAVGVESTAGSLGIQSQARELERATGRPIETQIVAKSASKAILDTARRSDCSLVVMGSRRPSGLSALGSVSRRVVHEAACSVLLVPPLDHER